jgi:LCP family protein required for cell wall assembly
VAGFIIAGLIGAGAYFAPLANQTLQSTGQTDGVAAKPIDGAPPPAPGAPFTVLLLGSDNDAAKFDKDHLLTQTMILVRIDPAAKQATMLSIPRDLWVPIPAEGGRKDKIMHAYGNGGAKAAVQAVQKNFQVKIDDYFWVGLKGLVALIDRMGGVDVVTSNPVLDDYYPADLEGAPFGYLRVAVLPGAQHLDGRTAMKYVRSRHGDLRGDLGRSARQQQVLLGLRSKAKGFNLADLPDIGQSLQGEVSTSISLPRFRSLLGLAAAFDSGGIQTQVLGPPYTRPAHIEGQDVLLPDWSQIQPLVRKSFPPG